jgi:hypothetical protein
MSTTNFQLDCKTVQQIIGSRDRATLTDAQKGETVKFNIQGDGFTLPVTDKTGAQVNDQRTGQPLYKTIYGVKANSEVAMRNPQNKAIFAEAMKAETAGDMEKAHTLYNQYLNKVQISFNVIINPGRETTTFRNKQLVEGELELITTENGQLITMKNVIAAEVKRLGKTPKFSLEELMGISNEEPNPEDLFTQKSEEEKTEITQD